MSDSVATSTAPDQLLTGNFPDIIEGEIILSGENLVRGTVLGKVTASGKLIELDIAAVDGSQNFFGVLAEDTDASAADKVAPVFKSGQFNEDALILGGATTIADIKDAARALNCYIQPTVIVK